MLSIVTPAFREAGNLAALHARLVAALGTLPLAWEWIIVDDHSPDATFAVIEQLAANDSRVRGLRLSRNSGSHQAIACGLAHANGAVAAVLAADLQDPPELLPELLAQWQAGAQVVWATRRSHARPGALDRASSRVFHALLRRLDGLAGLPASGADFFLIDRVVIDALAGFRERNANLLALIAWMGFRQASVPYDKGPREQGRSGWTLAKKLALAVDSITAFSYRPIRWMTYAGGFTALAGFGYAAFVAWLAVDGQPPSGWASLMVVVLVVGGMQMLMLGVLGEYVWRALDEARRRPRTMVESATPGVMGVPGVPTVAVAGRARLGACRTWGVESDLQPTIPKSDRLLAVVAGERKL